MKTLVIISTNQYLTDLHREHLVVLGLPHCSHPTSDSDFFTLLLLLGTFISTLELNDPFRIFSCHTSTLLSYLFIKKKVLFLLCGWYQLSIKPIFFQN